MNDPYVNNIITLAGWLINPGPNHIDEDGLESPSELAVCSAIRLIAGFRRNAETEPKRIVQNGEGGISMDHWDDIATTEYAIDRDGNIEKICFEDSRVVSREYERRTTKDETDEILADTEFAEALRESGRQADAGNTRPWEEVKAEGGDGMKTMEQLIDDVSTKGGVIVPSNQCTAAEITTAMACNRYHGTNDGTGFVRRPQEWLEQIDAEK